ncbi:hypothetical protein ACP70R_042816 [Stipagrostis hirtigluma subsp. patula]
MDIPTHGRAASCLPQLERPKFPNDRRHVHCLTGLPVGEKEIVMADFDRQRDVEEQLVSSIFGVRDIRNLNFPAISLFYDKLTGTGASAIETELLQLAKCYVLLASSMCLSPSSKFQILNRTLFSSVNDLQNSGLYDWSGFLLQDICHAASAARIAFDNG